MTHATALRILGFASISLLFASCETTNTSGSDGYASNYGTDGGYNPYPGQSGYGQSSPGNYTPPPPPVPEPDPYAFAPEPAPAPAPKKTTSSSSSSSTKKPSSSSSSTRTTHTVKSGDTLYSLARKHGTTVAKIKSANGLSSDLIRIGQKLKIP